MIQKVGKWYTTESHGSIGQMIREESFTCIPTINECLTYCQKFDNAVDVGTWIGDSTIELSKNFKNVFGFEPHPAVHECCLMNLKERSIKNCTIYPVGLSNKEQQANLYNTGTSFQGWISSKETFKSVIVETVTKVSTCTLDSFNLIDIDFIKIDVDSHEGWLLLGAKEFFKNNSPVVMMENKVKIHKDRQPDNMPNPITLLESYGYKTVKKLNKIDFLLVKEK